MTATILFLRLCKQEMEYKEEEKGRDGESNTTSAVCRTNLLRLKKRFFARRRYANEKEKEVFESACKGNFPLDLSQQESNTGCQERI